MRISTFQLYQQGMISMQNQQAKLQQTEMQISSGLRISKPSDDPSGAVKVLNLTAGIDVIDQFSRNISSATLSLSFEESVINGVNTNLQQIRELVVQGNNSSNSDEAKNSIAEQIYQNLDAMLALANTRDAGGEYIFAGFRVDAPPFLENSGVVSYQGDRGQRLVQIGEGSQVGIRDSGENVFLRIPSGDGNIQVVAAGSNGGTGVVGAFSASGAFPTDSHTVTFLGPSNYEVRNGAGTVISTGNYASGDSISVANAQFSMDGTPTVGDVITLSPSQNRDIFTTIKSIADALARPAPNPEDKARYHNELAQGLTNLDQALGHMNSIRAGIGARASNIDALDEINQDFKLHLQTVLSETQDLDYAEAITRFNLQLTSLQAAQQAFAKTTGLSLFQYI